MNTKKCICDQHVHSEFSMDCEVAVDEMCRAAIELGMAEIVFTDHCDINAHDDNIYVYDPDASYRAYMNAKDKYSGRLRVTCGIELGQGTQRPDAAEHILATHDYEFVLGSLHNLNRVPDFSFIKYDVMLLREFQLLWERYLDELREMIEWGHFNSLAHLTYPIRYLKIAGKELSLIPYYEQLRELFRILIEKNIALEINTSGIRAGIGETLPSIEIMKLYRDVGGRMVTVGSDSHFPEHIGSAVADTYDMLKANGFDYITVFHDGEPKKLYI